MYFLIRYVYVIVFFASEMNLVAKSAELFKSATKKRDLKKHLTFSRGLRPKSRKQNFATESSR